MRKLVLTVIMACMFMVSIPAASDAHTLSFSTTWARLNRSITHQYADMGYWITYRSHWCVRVNRHRVSCSFTLWFEDGDYICGKGYVKEIVNGYYRYRMSWRTAAGYC